MAPRRKKIPFNFKNYDSLVNEFSTKIRLKVDNQIECLKEFENQIKKFADDEKTCILAETPIQKLKRLDNIKGTSFSPAKGTPTKNIFESVITPKTSIINHFQDISNTSEIKCIDTSIAKLPIKRRNSNLQGPPQKIKRLFKPERPDSARNYATSKVINSESQKEQGRLCAKSAVKSRKATEERKIKLTQQRNENMKIEKSHRLSTQNRSKTNNQGLKIEINTQKCPQTQPPKSHIQNVKQKYSNVKSQVIRPGPFVPLSDMDIKVHNPDRKEGKANRRTFGVKTPNNLPINNYKITPEYVVKKPTVPPIDEFTSYDINNLRSDDSTDDEYSPRKQIPKWAKDTNLWLSMVLQNKDAPINGEEVFGPIPDVSDHNFFHNPNPRYNARSSSSDWQMENITLNIDKCSDHIQEMALLN